MSRYSPSNLSDDALLHVLATTLAKDRATTAELLAILGEVDARKLYVPAGYPSMHAYCLGELHLCEQAAFKRILAARTARRFPVILDAVAEGRLHLTAVVLLAPHLTEHKAEELLAAATDQTAAEIERFLAARFPKSDLLAWVASIPSDSPHRPEPTEVESGACQLSSRIVQNETVPVRCPRVKPLSAESFEVQFTLSREGHNRLRRVRELLSHEIPSEELAEVFEKLLELAIPLLEKRRFAATENPHPGGRRSTADTRHIPDDVRRAVWERDQGRCTFVSESGHRCEARKFVEFDHIEAFARGGEAKVEGIRLLCRTHNQYEAERAFGAEFMRHKRIAAAEARAATKARAAAAPLP